MSAHESCGAVGKFDCAADESIYEQTLDAGLGYGDTEAPVGWFCEVHLDDSDIENAEALAEHYGARYLIARENGDGRFWVEVYATAKDASVRTLALEEDYRAWYSGALGGEEESWDAR